MADDPTAVGFAGALTVCRGVIEAVAALAHTPLVLPWALRPVQVQHVFE